MPAVPDPILGHHSAAEAAPLLDELCEVYADAYGAVPGEDAREKSRAFREPATRGLEAPHYSLVTAHASGQFVGFVLGYGLRPGRRWWEGLTPEPPAGFTDETGSRTVVLAEIEVRKAWQGPRHRTRSARCVPVREVRRTGHARQQHQGHRHPRPYERRGRQKAGEVPGSAGTYFSEYTLYVLPLTRAEWA